MIDLRQGDCIEKMKEMEDNSIDLILCDPPYHLTSITKRFGKKGSAPATTKNNDGSFSRLSKGFMGKEWDGIDENGIGIAFSVDLWKEAYRVLKPGGYLMAFSGTRTYHRMAVAIEDAGFEVKDMIEWIYASGFPKALDISKQLQKKGQDNIAKQYEGYKTQLKPAHEPICLAMKPLSEKNFAENVMKWGAGGLNIDGTRIGYEDTPNPATNPLYRAMNGYKIPEKGQESNGAVKFTSSKNEINPEGRYPANLIISENISHILDRQSDKASRFFKNIEEERDYIPFIYQAKASKKERNSNVNGDVVLNNNHPTVKPIELLKYLLKMGLPPHNSVVLDMFAGSGTTGVAIEQLNKETDSNHTCILIERESEYIEIIKKRCCLEEV